MDRRRFLQGSAALAGAGALGPWWLTGCSRPTPGILVNDVDSQLNQATVSEVFAPRSLDELTAYVRALPSGDALAIAPAGGTRCVASSSRAVRASCR